MAEFLSKKLLHNLHVNNEVGENPVDSLDNLVLRLDTTSLSSLTVKISLSQRYIYAERFKFTIDWGDGERTSVDEELSSDNQMISRVFEHTYALGEFYLSIIKEGYTLESVNIYSNVAYTPFTELISWGTFEFSSVSINNSIRNFKAIPKGALHETCVHFPSCFNSPYLETLEENFLAEYPNITFFTYAFRDASNFQNAPSNLFDYANGSLELEGCFSYARVPNSLRHAFQNKTISGMREMFYYATNLDFTNYMFQYATIYGSAERAFAYSDVSEIANTFYGTTFYFNDSSSTLQEIFMCCDNLFEIVDVFNCTSFSNYFSLKGAFMNSMTFQPHVYIEESIFGSDYNTIYGVENNLTSFESCFEGCSSLVNQMYPYWYDNYYSLGSTSRCFYGCYNLSNYSEINPDWRDY